MLIPAVLNLPSAISPLWSRNAVSVHSYFPSKSLCWAEFFLIALICCILGWEELIQSDNCSLSPSSAAAPLPTGVHPAPGSPCPLPPRLWCKRALAAAHAGPFDPAVCAEKQPRYVLDTVTPNTLQQSQNIPLCLAHFHSWIKRQERSLWAVRWNPASWQDCPAVI